MQYKFIADQQFSIETTKVSSPSPDLSSGVSAFEATKPGQIFIPKPPEVKFTNLGLLITNAVTVAMLFSVILAFIFLVLGGLQWIISGGDKVGTEAAKTRITSALLGLFIVFAAWAIIKVVETFFGICVLSCPIIIPIP